MLILLLELLLVDLCKGLKAVPDNILYHELVDYSKSLVKHEHYRHRREISAYLSLSFQAYNKLFYLKLSKNNDVFTHDVKFTSSTGKEIPYDFYSLVKGTVNDDSESLVHGSIHDGVFEGVINYQNETYHLEPSLKYYDNPDKHSLIYRFSDVMIDSQNNKCGVKDENGSYYSIPRQSLFQHVFDEGKIKYYGRSRRQASEDTTVTYKYCPLYMAADFKFYSQHSSGFAPAILSKLGTYVQEINDIYSNTEFPTYNYRVKFLIRKAHVYESPDNIYDNTEYAVARFLDVFSTKDDKQLNPDDYCIAYMFTHRDFEDGVLGLAWVASSGRDSGGLCTTCKTYDAMRPRCLNTGIVTTRNVKEVPALQSYLTFGHELGHNLGSPHDPTSCSPGSGNGGNFLMYPHANTGHDTNNKKLSACSTEIMGPILSIRASCFEDNPHTCGDFRKDTGEMCDCGDSVNCEKDKCCTTECVFTEESYTCSQMEGVCCNAEICQPYQTTQEASDVVCSNATDCKDEIRCSANSFVCPVDDADSWKDAEDGGVVLCNKGTQVCKEGECTASLCIFADTTSCQCTEEAYKCKLCCSKTVDGEAKCIAANNTEAFPELQEKVNDTTSYLLPGSVCGDDMGYCDILYVCRIVDADGPIASLGNYVFNGVMFDSAKNLALQYWYYCIMLGIGMICFMSAFIAVCSKTVKPPAMPRGGERMSYPVTYKNVNSMEMRQGHL